MSKTMKQTIGMAVVGALALANNALAVDLAKVNGKVISDRDMMNALSNLNEGQRQSVMKDPGTRRQVLTSVIDEEILVQEAEKSKLDQTQEYKDAMNAFKRQFLASRVLQKNLSSKFTEAAAKKYYEGHKDLFSSEQVHALHILVKEENEARDLAKKSKNMSVEEFQALAEKVSKDPSAKNNRGDLGFFGRDRMVREFTDAAFGGAEGAVVGPVKTSYGYHVIKVIKKQPGKVAGYDEVELKVKSALRQELTQNYVEGLKKQAKVEVNDKAVDKM